MRKQITRVLPLITLKLPRLARREDRDDALPVVRLELVGRVDEDEAEGALRVYGWHEPRGIQDVGTGHGGCGGGVGRHEDAVLEKLLDV